MPEIGAVECEVEEVVEPLALEHEAGFVVLLAVLPGEDERFLQGLSLALGDTAGEVQIDQRVVVHVEQGAAVRLLVIDRRLPCLPPRGDVLFGEALGLLVQFDKDVPFLLYLRGELRGEVEYVAPVPSRGSGHHREEIIKKRIQHKITI